ncbi:glycoside hydrolase family 127 protein [Cuneatibacter sp. NSJ-177]|uniref:beta-L-arabinofuranosidase domain-containing protein n=1 Tax=Cuneatibacter sp. NSJ-177 TaxID=2931401 RepID=UPI001FD1CD71|nr:beta-L-arabinofuranosidase domain-containing protein [Cuneatibacter sp. NSJ-177]MCJ7835786.1 glycoside hydrolase family 127 protein [Cuneatibacter sp. NSJ-177]
MSEIKSTLAAREIILKDLAAIYIGNLNTVDNDLILPKTGKYGSSFCWSTNESRFIDETGKVHRPLHGMGNRNVTLKVTAAYEDAEMEKEFLVTVLQEAKETKIVSVRDVNVYAKPYERAELPSVVIVDCADGRRMTLPVAWDLYEPLSYEGTVCVAGSIMEGEKRARAIIHYGERKPEINVPCEKLRYYPITDVKLLDGTLYYEYQQDMLTYLLNCDDDQMLYNFRKAAGLDTLGAPPMTGWDDEKCKLRGHTTGHYLSGLALAWGVSKDDRLFRKLVYLVDELQKCQEAFAESGNCHRGFLSAYSEEQFDLLEQFVKYPEIWAPYYTLDKIMSGLCDCYEIAGIEKAKEILTLMADWVFERLSRLSKKTLDQMWSMYIAGEYGGMIGTMVKVYRLTKSVRHLEAARLFDNEKLFIPMEENCDTLEDIHANQHIPQVIGAMELFRTTGEERYWKIGKHFWEIVTGGHIYCIGGLGETEMFHRAGTTCSYLTERAAESCASYNMLRLTGQLFAYTADGDMMDYYDNTLRNHILTSSSHACDGGTTYFMPLEAGGSKMYSTEENTCCHGTGMESRFRYMEHIYAYSEDFVYINLFIDSELSGEENLEIRNAEEDKIKIFCRKDMSRRLKLHIPEWARKNFAVWVNGAKVKAAELEKEYFTVPGLRRAGDEIVIHMPMELRLIGNHSDSSFVNIAYGPYILAALSEEKEFRTVPKLSDLKPAEGRLLFEADGIRYLPFAMVDTEAYHVYFKKRTD